MAAAAHFLIRKELFNSKYPQLLVAKDFAVAEKKLHLTVSRRKHDPGKKAPKKRRTSNGKTTAPKPSTSQDQPQSESVTEQQPQSESVTEQQPQSKTTTDTHRNMSHHNSAAMTHFQMRFPHPQRLLRQKIQNLYQRNQNIV